MPVHLVEFLMLTSTMSTTISLKYLRAATRLTSQSAIRTRFIFPG